MKGGGTEFQVSTRKCSAACSVNSHIMGSCPKICAQGLKQEVAEIAQLVVCWAVLRDAA